MWSGRTEAMAEKIRKTMRPNDIRKTLAMEQKTKDDVEKAKAEQEARERITTFASKSPATTTGRQVEGDSTSKKVSTEPETPKTQEEASATQFVCSNQKYYCI